MSDKYLTTGDVAKLFCVSTRTAAKWFDAGRIQGFRLPGGGNRRFRLASFVTFAAKHEIPITLPPEYSTPQQDSAA